MNLGGFPQRIDDEGTYTAQAFAVNNFGQLAHYTYWYDHPPLGWLQIAMWTELTGAFERYDVAVLAAREVMAVASTVAAAMLWLLARRLKLSRLTAAAVLVIFALSPLTMLYQRYVFLDNVATPWLLAAFVLVFAPRRQLAAFAAAAVCFAVAALTKETYLLLLPFLGWQMWRQAHRGTRRYTVSLAAAITVVLGLCYVLLAALKGELLPGANRVSLVSGIGFQLAGREGSGSVLDPSSRARGTVDQWLQTDPAILVCRLLAALVLLPRRRFTPVASGLIFLAVFLLRPGYLPMPYVIVLLPFSALLIPAAVEVSIKAARARAFAPNRRLQLTAATVVVVLAVALAVPNWRSRDLSMWQTDQDKPMRMAQAYLTAYVGRGSRIVVDDAIWVDLVRAGFDRRNVVWYYKVDTDPDVTALAPNGWRDYDYVVRGSDSSTQAVADGSATVSQAMANSTLVAAFGTGEDQVTISRVQDRGINSVNKEAGTDRRARAAEGRLLAENDALELSDADRALLVAGRVDTRIMLALAAAAKVGTVTVEDLQAVEGEEAAQRPRRQMIISTLSGVPVSQSKLAGKLVARLSDEKGRYEPAVVTPTAAGGLFVGYGIDAPTGLLTAGGRS